ncbi:MAG TPA: hypothetical protein VF883_14800 [Thermoanaerobaculia bacterium]|jgi:hypothetical protein
MQTVRTAALALVLLTNVSLFARTIGREKPVTESASAQQHVALSRDQYRTLLAWEETAAPGQLSRVRVHQYEAPFWFLGRETFSVQSSPRHQRTPVFGESMVAWLEEDPASSARSVWYQPIQLAIGKNYQPVGAAQKVGDAARNTPLHVLNYHVFHGLVWTGTDGRLTAAERSLIARIGFDPTPWYATHERAENPAADGDEPSLNGWSLIAYNVGGPDSPCTIRCTRPWLVKATVLGGREPQQSIVISELGASAPDVVQTATDYLIFWSDVEDGGTFVQRVTTTAGIVVRAGANRKVHDGELHDASIAPNDEVVMVVEEGQRFLFLRLDRDLNVVERIPFTATLAAESRIGVSSRNVPNAMIAYTTLAADGVTPRAVFRVVEDGPGSPKRRAIR